jgi:hypothetical protein
VYLPGFQEAKVMMGRVASTRVGVVWNVLFLDLSFMKLDTLKCCDCATLEQSMTMMQIPRE